MGGAGSAGSAGGAVVDSSGNDGNPKSWFYFTNIDWCKGCYSVTLNCPQLIAPVTHGTAQGGEVHSASEPAP